MYMYRKINKNLNIYLYLYIIKSIKIIQNNINKNIIIKNIYNNINIKK